jgi:Holliday junction DNA helicase RuvB
MATQVLDGQYPDGWDDFVGQASAKRALRISAISAKKRAANMPHTLICSPYAGVGKTAIALCTARELDRPMYVVSGAMKINEARVMFSRLEDGMTVFYDEMHKIMDNGKKNAEWLLHYFENGVLITPFGEEKVPQVTFIGATTDRGLLPGTILDRMKIVELDAYTDAEGASIAATMARKVLEPEGLPCVSDEVAAAVAAAASNQPRRMRDLLFSLRDLAVVGELEVPEDGSYDLTEPLAFADLTADGLTKEARKYLDILYTEMRAEPAGAALMRERMGLVGRGLNVVEQLLLDKNLITKTKQGRMLTGAGIKRATALTDEG